MIVVPLDKLRLPDIYRYACILINFSLLNLVGFQSLKPLNKSSLMYSTEILLNSAAFNHFFLLAREV
jgi:hypothetical protein